MLRTLVYLHLGLQFALASCSNDHGRSPVACRAPNDPNAEGTLPLCAPSCEDAVQNGDETGVDCGGTCEGCLGAACAAATDCASRHCDGGVCVTAACAAAPCKHDGICVDGPGGAISCACPDGWSGPRCERSDGCHAAPCGAGTCHDDGAGGYSCQCPAGTAPDGVTCAACAPITDCAEVVCTGPSDATCARCHAGFEDDGEGGCKPSDDCAPNPCGAGECVDTGLGTYACECPIGQFADGQTCAACATVVACAQVSCTGPDDAQCVACQEGFELDGAGDCRDIDDCAAAPCGPGTCADAGVDAYDCTCPAGTWDSGTSCEACAAIASCDAVVCTSARDETCARCASGFEPDGAGGCRDVNDCADEPCGVGGSCTDGGANAYACACEVGLFDDGLRCAACDPIPNCELVGCADKTDEACMECAFGYADNGAGRCVDIDGCAGDPCAGGSCVDERDGYRCDCPPGEYDDATTCVACAPIAGCAAVTCTSESVSTCAECAAGFVSDGAGGCADANDCAPNPCGAGTCTDTGTNAYTCACPAGHFATGSTCLACDPLANCVSVRCTNARDESCATCDAGFVVGPAGACVDADDCQGNPCGQGTCTDTGRGSYSCACPTGSYSDGVTCRSCTSIAHCGTAVSCTGANDATCAGCAVGYWGTGTACTAWRTCGAGQYEAAAPSATSDRSCADCDAIQHCATVSCTTAGNETCSQCAAGYEPLGDGTCGSVDDCAGVTACEPGVCVDGVGGYTCAFEDCGQPGDEDGDGLADCDDLACARVAACSAPPLDPTIPDPSFVEGVEFLYTGLDPIQVGVTPATIEPERAAVLRGRVVTVLGDGHPGVTVKVVGHPELGSTTTDPLGEFSLVVNGGGQLTVGYERSGYLPIQRHAEVPWQDYVVLPDVVLTALDTKTTAIELGLGTDLQVAQGSVVSDADGQRQATLLWQADTEAWIEHADGTREPITDMTIRATEYTVGPTGPAAMPGELPASVAYTYAVELSADEIDEAQGEHLAFDPPASLYVENYVGFPVGETVPLGYYDRDMRAWVPAPSGRVLALVGLESDGRARLDTDGDGDADADDDAALGALGVTEAERLRVGALYTVGQELWRVSLAHFSPWDCNWAAGLPLGAEGPNRPRPKQVSKNPKEPCPEQGSIIGPNGRTLGLQLPIAGTPLRLHFNSRRSSGRQVGLNISLSGPEVPAALEQIELRVSVAGRSARQNYPPNPNQTVRFIWDGRDAFGRTVSGDWPVDVEIGYTYDAVYYPVSRFSDVPNGMVVIGDPRDVNGTTIWQRFQLSLERPEPHTAAAGGWTIDVHHTYDRSAHVVYRGDGTRQSVEPVGDVLGTVAGTRVQGFSGDGELAVQAQLHTPAGLAYGPDGSLYIADQGNHNVRRVAPDGVIETVVGVAGTAGFSGDGGPAIDAELNAPRDLAVGSDGSLYVADTGNFRIRRVSPDGIIETVAGNGTMGPVTDGTMAVDSPLYLTTSVSVAPDGSVYFVDFDDVDQPVPVGPQRVHRIDQGGVVTTVLGGGNTVIDPITYDPSTPILSRELALSAPWGLAVDRDGYVFTSDASLGLVLRARPDGVVEVFAGLAQSADNGDGGAALSAVLGMPAELATDDGGGLVVIDPGAYELRRIWPSGQITTHAGIGFVIPEDPGISANGVVLPGAISEDGRPARSPILPNFGGAGLAVSPRGVVVFSEEFRVRSVSSPPIRTLSNDETIVPSEGGTELFVFDRQGRHLRTLEGFMQTPIYTFDYDLQGRLEAVRDRYDNVISLERSAVTGLVTAIVGAHGARTDLAYDAQGYLAEVSNSALGTWAIGNSTAGDGLVESLTEPGGGTRAFTYDLDGGLIRDVGPTGGTLDLEPVVDGGDEVEVTRADGQVVTYGDALSPTGELVQTVTSAAGTMTTTLATNGDRTVVLPTGDELALSVGADPRWGLSAPIIASATHTRPGAGVLEVSLAREVTLADPADPLSATRVVDSWTSNERTSSFDVDLVARTAVRTTPLGREHHTTFNANGALLSSQADGRAAIAWSYDAQGRATGMNVGASQFSVTYEDGRLATLSDPTAATITLGYDATGRRNQLTSPGGRVLSWSFDAAGNPETVTTPNGATHSVGYDAAGRMTSYQPPGGGGYWTMDRDASGDVQTTTLPSGTEIDYANDDPTGRLVSIVYPEATVTLTHDAHGLLASMERQPVQGMGAAQGVTFSRTGHVIEGISFTGAAQAEFAFTWNPDLAPTSIAIGGGPVIDMTYDDDQRTTALGPFQLAYEGAGGVLSRVSRTSDQDEVFATEVSPDALGRTASRRHYVNGQLFYALEISYDALSRRASTTETVPDPTSQNPLPATKIVERHFEYDADGQLVAVRDGDDAALETYTYDANRNRLSRALGADVPETASYDARDRLITAAGVAYTYSADGFLAARGGDTFTYSARGELVSAQANGAPSAVEYSYDGFGRVVSRTEAALTWQFFYGDPLDRHTISAWREPDGTLAVPYWTPSGRLYAIERRPTNSDAQWLYVAVDPIGTPRVIVTEDGALVEVRAYDAFGAVRADSNPGFLLPIGFAGGLEDSATGLVRFGLRDYEPGTGRWTAPDPLLFGGGWTNLYLYVGNDPVNRRDPAGLDDGNGGDSGGTGAWLWSKAKAFYNYWWSEEGQFVLNGIPCSVIGEMPMVPGIGEACSLLDPDAYAAIDIFLAGYRNVCISQGPSEMIDCLIEYERARAARGQGDMQSTIEAIQNIKGKYGPLPITQP